jgi:hypothetical protein
VTNKIQQGRIAAINRLESLAFESYEKTLKVDDMHYGALLHLAILQASKAEFLIAEKNLQKALQINPNDPEPW